MKNCVQFIYDARLYVRDDNIISKIMKIIFQHLKFPLNVFKGTNLLVNVLTIDSLTFTVSRYLYVLAMYSIELRSHRLIQNSTD